MSKRKRTETNPAMDFFTSARRSQTVTSPATLIAFYEETGTDSRGRHLADILRWGEPKLESSHDYIQTLFPLPERSGVNDRAPVIDGQVFEAFRSREDLRDKLRDAFRKMLWFYGFQLEENEEGGKLIITKGHNYERHSQNWLSRFDHNHLRITRIIRCLRVLGLEIEARAFYNVISTATIVSARSRMYWERAAHRPLNIRPDVDDELVDERIGPKFLREFEQANRDKSMSKSATEGVESAAMIIEVESSVENGSVNQTEKSNEEASATEVKVDPSGELGESEKANVDEIAAVQAVAVNRAVVETSDDIKASGDIQQTDGVLQPRKETEKSKTATE